MLGFGWTCMTQPLLQSEEGLRLFCVDTLRCDGTWQLMLTFPQREERDILKEALDLFTAPKAHRP